jgi:hypothetical protein
VHLVGSVSAYALEGALKDVCLGGRAWEGVCLGCCVSGWRVYALEGVCLGGRVPWSVSCSPWTGAWGVMLSPQAHRHKSCDKCKSKSRDHKIASAIHPGFTTIPEKQGETML